MPSSPSVVFLVEDFNTNDGHMTYWAHTYLSEKKARAGVEYWAAVKKKGDLTWHGTAASWLDGTRAYAIVALGVHPDDKPEAARAL